MIIDKIEECICKGNKEELDIIFNDNTIDCNIMLSSNQTPLIKSAINEHYDLVLYFLKKKVQNFGFSIIKIYGPKFFEMCQFRTIPPTFLHKSFFF